MEAEEVNLPASDGYLGILAGHAPLIATIGTGIVTLRHEAKPQRYFIASGMFSVNDNRVQILADVAESKETDRLGACASEQGTCRATPQRRTAQ